MTHELLLSDSNWRGVERAKPNVNWHHAASRREVGGPNVTLKAEAARAVAIVLHELSTNAAKHGAFTRAGRLLLRWWWQSDRLAIE